MMNRFFFFGPFSRLRPAAVLDRWFSSTEHGLFGVSIYFFFFFFVVFLRPGARAYDKSDEIPFSPFRAARRHTQVPGPIRPGGRGGGVYRRRRRRVDRAKRNNSGDDNNVTRAPGVVRVFGNRRVA